MLNLHEIVELRDPRDGFAAGTRCGVVYLFPPDDIMVEVLGRDDVDSLDRLLTLPSCAVRSVASSAAA